MMHQSTKSRKFRKFDLENPNIPIVLVGMMGAGKTTIGRRLATRLGISFVDADFEIEKAAGQTIADLFETYGEEAFRSGERRVIARLIDGRPRVIATGGGAFSDPETRKLALGKALVVWLDADIEILLERTARRSTRPLLNKGNPRETLLRLWNERRHQYAQAHIHVKSSAGPHEKVVNTIIKALDNRIKEDSTS